MLTAIVTNHDYARFLPKCIESALEFCDEVLVYDDGSTDDSLEVLSRYPVKVTHRPDATGDPVWGSNLGIQDATSDYLMFLDADNYLIAPPLIGDTDYTYADILIVGEAGEYRDLWRYAGWPLTAADAMRKFRTDHQMPYPWGGVWRTDFVKPLRWMRWPHTSFAADFRTALEWCKHSPTLAYSPQPFLAFRTHEGQWSASPERAVMQQDAATLARSL